MSEIVFVIAGALAALALGVLVATFYVNRGMK